MRLELFSRGKTIVDAETYNRFFTLHGAIMVFLFIIPSVPAALGNFFLPIMIGAKDVAFPRLNMLSFYIYILGVVFLMTSIIIGAVDTGWTFYTPYSVQTVNSVISMTLGVFILGFSSILTGLNFLVTVHKMRAPGVTWTRLPLFVWGMYATALMQVLATPVLAITLLLLMRRALLRHRHLRSEARRRPGALPALLLVLLAPGRLHHDRPGNGHHQRAHRHVLAARHLRVLRRRDELASASRSSASSCGATTCSWPA